MFLIGIAGGSGSGKTTFTEKIVNRAGRPEGLLVLHQDSYYLPEMPQSICKDGVPNFDHPMGFDWQLLSEHLERLKLGQSIDVPIYDYTTSQRLAETERVGPAKVVLFEGIYALWDPTIREKLDTKVFLHVDADIRFIRRLYRDVRERARNLDGIIHQYYDSVRPMHHEYLEPTRQFADIIVGEETDVAAFTLAARVLEMLKES